MENLSISLEVFLNLLIAIIAFFCAITIYIVPLSNKKTIRLLVYFFLVLSIGYTLSFFEYAGFYHPVNLSSILLLFGFVSYLLFFYFVQKYLRKDYKLNSINMLVYLPSLFVLIIVPIDFILKDSNVYEKVIYNNYFYVLDRLYILLLNAINLYTIYWYRKTVLNTQSSLNKHDYKWISHIVYATIFYSIFPIFLKVITSTTSLTISKEIRYILFDVLTIVFYFYVMIKTLLNARNTNSILFTSETNFTNKYTTSRSPTQEQILLSEEIKLLFSNYQTYKDSELNIEQLASIMSVKPRFLSSTINTCFGKNFYDFINYYRIEEAKRIIQSSSESGITIAEVMYEVGYNSKSSFYSEFKKRTGNTPTHFKK